MINVLSSAQVRRAWVKHQEKVRRTRLALEAADAAFPSRLDSADRGRMVDPFRPTPDQLGRISDALAGIPSQHRRRG